MVNEKKGKLHRPWVVLGGFFSAGMHMYVVWVVVDYIILCVCLYASHSTCNLDAGDFLYRKWREIRSMKIFSFYCI